MCNGKIRNIVETYTSRFEYYNAKVVLRAVVNEVDLEKVSHSILPELNDINTPWLKIIESADDLRSAVVQMRRKSFGPALMAVAEDARLSDYEDALDVHYFKKAWDSVKGNAADIRFLKDLLGAEIDHRNLLNILEAEAVGISSDDIVSMLVPGDVSYLLVLSLRLLQAARMLLWTSCVDQAVLISLRLKVHFHPQKR